MGASGWKYFVPYETDTNAALQRLMQQVFEHGEYYKRDYGKWRDMTEEDAIEAFYDEMEPDISEIFMDDWRAVKELAEPTDPMKLFEWNQESGTHSIIDMHKGISEQPEFGTLSPLTSEQLLKLFGTEHPTHQMVVDLLSSNSFRNLRNRWEGLYIIVYENDLPNEYLFTGFSGD